ncbi:MAG: response regulator [Okeania sp.]|nr:response regulator [Okeania sp.]
MLNQAKNQLNKNNINEELDKQNNTKTHNEDSIDDWFNSLESRDIDNNDNLIVVAEKENKGPEVGASELNSLADLFEGETPDLDSSWEEEVLDQGELELDQQKISQIDTDDDDDISEFLFDINDPPQSPKFSNKNKWDVVSPKGKELSDLFEKIGKNELDKSSNYEIKNSNDLANIFGDLENGELSELEDMDNPEIDWQLDMNLEANTSQAQINLTSQNQAENSELDKLDWSDLLAIEDVDKRIKSDTKAEESQLNINTTNDLISTESDLESLFEDLEEIPVESDDLTSSLAELFEQQDLGSSSSQDLTDLEQLDWQNFTQNDDNDLNSLLDDKSLDFAHLLSESKVERNHKNQVTSEAIENLWSTLQEAKDNNEFHQGEADILGLDELPDVVTQKTDIEIEKSQELIANKQTKIEDYEFIALEAILKPEKYNNYNVFEQLERLLNGKEIHSEFQVNTGVVNQTHTQQISIKRTSKSQEIENQESLSEEDKSLENYNIDTSKSLVVSTTNAPPPRRKSRPLEQTIKVPAKQLDNLSNLVGELVVNRNSLEQGQERMRQFLDNLLHQVMLLSDAGQRMHDLYEKTLLERAIWDSRHGHRSVNTSHVSNTENNSETSEGKLDPLDLDRAENFTPFHLLAQETIEYIVRVRESASDIEFLVDDAEQVTRQLRQVTTQLQEGFTKSRMIPFSQTVQLLPRYVRDRSIEFGKEVELQVEGTETLIDKMIQDKLSDPMKHLINNAIAHGVETSQERISAGKSPKGQIKIRAFHQGNQTVISVADDGAGINPEKVKHKAIKKRVISQKQAQEMSTLDVYDLLFHPGFSTKDKVDELSGRGVGLDVVKTNLTEIRGTITIDSSIGKGTIFTIRLPLTLSISKALCCISDRSRIAFPMDGVEDMIKVDQDDVKTAENGQNYVEWRGAKLPFSHLRDLLVYNRNLRRGNVYGVNAEEDMISIVVLRSASVGIFLAVQVDQVLEQQEIVIKQLEGPVPKPMGIAGATVLGDGKIVAIADVIELINLATGKQRRDEGNIWPSVTQDTISLPTENKSELTVLIVDDSITVRELLSMTFSKAGYRVEQARDGQDAWEKLRAGLPCDLVFCDIEMPRMDGFELLSRVKSDSHLEVLPMAMLTSRGAAKHRKMAFDLGAKGYFTKPFIEDKLLEGAVSILEGKTVGDVVTAVH